MKKLISNHINGYEEQIDVTESVLNQLRSPKKRRRPIVLVAILILTFATTVYAATIKLIELSNENGSTDMEITLLEPSIETNRDLFKDFDFEMIPNELRETVSMTLYIPDPTEKSVNHFVENINDYNDIYIYEMSGYLPETLSYFTFKDATVGYHYNMPEQEELDSIAAQHSDEIFYTFPLEITKKTIIYYNYLNTNNHLFFDISLTEGQDKNYYPNDKLIEYEVIDLEHTEAFVFKRANSDFTYENGERVDKIIGNNYEIIWYDRGYKYSIRPSKANKLYPDIKVRHIYNFPDSSKEDLIALAKLINIELYDSED
jgi:hypothetical protein